MRVKRCLHAICFYGDRIIVAGGDNGSQYLDTCEAFDTKSNRYVYPTLVVLPTIVLEYGLWILLLWTKKGHIYNMHELPRNTD